VEECQKAIELDPASVRALFTLGSVHFVRGELGEAISTYSEVIRLGEKVDDPLVASAYYARGKAYQSKAEADFAAAIKRGLDSSGKWPTDSEAGQAEPSDAAESR
jgi:tetratricopeptide (TPR) repeat protein